MVIVLGGFYAYVACNTCIRTVVLQATVTLLENIEVLMAKSPKADIRSDVLPMVYNSFESTAPQIQCASIRAAAHVAEFLDENAVRKMVLPRTRSVFETNSGQKVSEES